MHVLHTIWRKAYCRAEAFFRTGSTPFYAHVKCFPDRPVCGIFARRFSACNFFIAALLMLLTANQSALAVPPGTLISNTASASFGISGNPETRPSNTVEISSTLALTPSKAVLYQYSPSGNAATATVSSPTGCSLGSPAGPFPPLSSPDYPGAGALDVSNPVDLVRAKRYHQGEPVFVGITDKNRNLDRTQRDSVEINIAVKATGDQEQLQLFETGVDTGVFVGFIQTVAPGSAAFDCQLAVTEESKIRASYTDPFDNTDTANSQALVDPFGIVFDSVSGDPVDGATVSILDASTGQPAQVLGDDGISTFPASVISGGTATDSNGTVYSFPPGGYRFPFMATGNYRIEVSAPAHTAPSDVRIAELQRLPQAPFALDAQASYANDFPLNAGPPLNIDIPVDPAGSDLVLQKQASRNQAASGDFVSYTLELVNNSTRGNATGIVITDVLPVGLRYQSGSAQRNQAALSDPDISSDGRTLRFAAGALPPGESVQISYVVEVTVGTPFGEAINVATASDNRGSTSNSARATIIIEDELLTSRSFIPTTSPWQQSMWPVMHSMYRSNCLPCCATAAAAHASTAMLSPTRSFAEIACTLHSTTPQATRTTGCSSAAMPGSTSTARLAYAPGHWLAALTTCNSRRLTR